MLVNKELRLQNFPISFFSVILGLAGVAIAWQRGEVFLHLPFAISPYILVFTIAAFVYIAAIYLVKLIRYPDRVREELEHPIQVNFFPAFSISLLLISIAALAWNLQISRILWITGTIIQFIFTLIIVSGWMHRSHFQIHHLNPAWFIPAVGNIIVPIAGVVHAPAEINWLFFSTGITFWLVLMVIFFYRLFFHPPLPTLFILIAPPAIGFLSYVKLSGSINDFAMFLYFFALFLTILLVTQVDQFRRIRFYLIWWAYSFPISAMTISSLRMAIHMDSRLLSVIAVFLLILLSVMIIGLLTATLVMVWQRKICINEDELEILK